MSVKDTKEGDPIPRWNLGGLAGPSELWTCKRLRLEQLILKRDRQVRILKVSPKNSELLSHAHPSPSMRHRHSSGIFMCIETLTIRVMTITIPHTETSWKNLTPKKNAPPCWFSIPAWHCRPRGAPCSYDILRPAKLNSLVTRWHGTFPLRNMTWYGNIAESDCQRLPFQQDLHCMQ